MCSEAVLQRCSPRNMHHKHKANPQDSSHAEALSQQSRLDSLLKSKPRASSRKSAAHLQNTLLQENTSGGLLVYVKRILNNLNDKKFLFTVSKEIY